VELTRKMDEIIGRQERTLSVVSGIQGGQIAPGGGGQPMGGGGIPVDTIRRDEVNAVLANQKEIVSASRDIKNFVVDIHTKTGQLMQRGSAQPVGGGGGGSGPDYSGTLSELRESLNLVRRDMTTANAKLSAQAQQAPLKCPEVAAGGGGNCVSTTVFIVLLAIQMVVIIAYLMYRDSKEAQAKKFY